MLELLILIFDRCFQPVLRIKIHHDTALIEAVVAVGEIGFHYEREVFFICLRLQNGSVIVAEMIVRSLPQVCMRLGHDLNAFIADIRAFRRSCPFHILGHCCSSVKIQSCFLYLIVGICLILPPIFTRSRQNTISDVL